MSELLLSDLDPDEAIDMTDGMGEGDTLLLVRPDDEATATVHEVVAAWTRPSGG